MLLSAEQPMLRFLLNGTTIEGAPLVWEKQFAAVLARDGKWINLEPHQAEELRTVSNDFRPFPMLELRTRLEQEFGREFEVAGDVHYLVVHPRGQRSTWAPRFEQLYRSFQQYFTARGWRPQEPQFPLVAVVFPSEQQFHKYAAREGSKISPNTLGYYSPLSNRILLFDTTSATTSDWSMNAETIIHEAAHQTAFNTGVHNRFAHPPRWLIEGLGTLFEAKGVWDSSRYKSQTDRMNRLRFTSFQKYAKERRKTGALAEIVSSDRPFESDIDGAYAEAWALTFFLSETDPRGYMALLKKTAEQENFTERRSPERLADFTSVFGSNLKLLEAKMLRFMNELK
jgi:Protein of unknown function (DUF1570)